VRCADAARISERVGDIVQDLRRFSGGQEEQSTRFELAGMIRKAVHWGFKASRVRPDVSCYLPEELEIEGRQGTGLGLSISFGLARYLGGDLAARGPEERAAVFTLAWQRVARLVIG